MNSTSDKVSRKWWKGVEAEFDCYGVDISRCSTRRNSGRYGLCFDDGSWLRVPSMKVARAVAAWVAHERPRRDDREDHATIAAHARHVFDLDLHGQEMTKAKTPKARKIPRLRALLLKVADHRPDSMAAHEFVEQVVWTLEAIIEHDDKRPKEAK